MKDSQFRLQILDGGSSPKKYARRSGEEAEQLTCKTCEALTGIPTSVWQKVTLAPMVRKGRVEGGTTALVCSLCLARGVVTRAT